MTTGTDMDDGSPEITLEDFDRFLKELLPKYEDTLAGRLAYVHAVLSFGLENPAPVEYLARCVIKERIALRIALTARDDALVSIRVLVQDCIENGYFDGSLHNLYTIRDLCDSRGKTK